MLHVDVQTNGVTLELAAEEFFVKNYVLDAKKISFIKSAKLIEFRLY